MELNLSRPLVFFDLETTGTNITTDRIVEISTVKVMPDNTIIEKTRRINPGIHIPEESTAIHHITDDDVKDCPTFKQIASSLAQFMTGCDIAGYNSNRFDIPLLSEEFFRAGISFDFTRARFIDVQTIFHKKEQRTLSAAYRFYCNAELENSHSANADTLATLAVLKAQLDRYPDLVNEVEALAEFSSQNRNVDLMGRMILDDKGREVINFGKHKGKLAADVLRTEPAYFAWIQQGDFTRDTKNAFLRVQLRNKKS